MFGLSLSGLQSFVYDVHDEGAARPRRLRSALLSLVPAVIALQRTRKDAGTKIHYLGGGKLLYGGSAESVEYLKPSLRSLEPR